MEYRPDSVPDGLGAGDPRGRLRPHLLLLEGKAGRPRLELPSLKDGPVGLHLAPLGLFLEPKDPLGGVFDDAGPRRLHPPNDGRRVPINVPLPFSRAQTVPEVPSRERASPRKP